MDSKELLLSDSNKNIPNPITEEKTCNEIFDWWKTGWQNKDSLI